MGAEEQNRKLKRQIEDLERQIGELQARPNPGPATGGGSQQPNQGTGGSSVYDARADMLKAEAEAAEARMQALVSAFGLKLCHLTALYELYDDDEPDDMEEKYGLHIVFKALAREFKTARGLDSNPVTAQAQWLASLTAADIDGFQVKDWSEDLKQQVKAAFGMV